MAKEDTKVFDITKPGDSRPETGAKPMVVGHKFMKDPSVSEPDDKKPEETEQPIAQTSKRIISPISEEKSSYLTDIVDDIKVLLGNRDSLSDNDINQIAQAHGVDNNEVIRTLKFVKSEQDNSTQKIPSTSVEAEEVNDFFKFLRNNPRKGTKASIQYISTLNRNLAKPKTNPMVNRFIKLTKYMFNWEETYKDRVQRTNPDWELQKRKGDYTKMERLMQVLSSPFKIPPRYDEYRVFHDPSESVYQTFCGT